MLVFRRLVGFALLLLAAQSGFTQDRALVAYTGGYRVEGDRWITKVDVAANPAWAGTEQARAFRVTGDRLQEISPWMARPDGRMARGVITYERSK